MPDNRNTGTAATDVKEFLDEIEKGDVAIPPEREPEVIVAEPEKPTPAEPVTPPPSPVTPPAPVTPPDPLAQALASIDELKRKNLELEGRFETLRRPVEPPPAVPTREPEVETIEVLGYRVPKESGKRAVRITAQDLVNLGWNEDPAGAIEKLANVFVAHLANVLVGPAIQGARAEDERVTTARRQRGWFDGEYGDLREENDLLKTVEAGVMSEAGWEKRNQKDHLDEVAKRARTHIARWRGQTYDQYVEDFTKANPSKTTPTPTPTRGRAVTTTSGARAPIVASSEMQKDLDDTAKDAVRR